MNNKLSQNKPLYIEDHLSCRNYLEKVEHGFKYTELERDEVLLETDSRWNCLLFVLEGQCVIHCNQFKEALFPEGSITLLPKKSKIEIHALAGTRLLSLSFDVPLNKSDKFSLEGLVGLCERMDYKFRPIEIRYPLPPYLELVTFCLRSKMDCGHFHLLLEQELFFLLRGFYLKEELALLFYPIISPELSFKDFVLDNYLKVSSVNELITLSNMGRSPFFHKFKKTFGMSAKQWLMKRRDMDILSKIEGTRPTVSELMQEFNFDSQSYFTNYCKKHFQCTPRELIQKFRA